MCLNGFFTFCTTRYYIVENKQENLFNGQKSIGYLCQMDTILIACSGLDRKALICLKKSLANKCTTGLIKSILDIGMVCSGMGQVEIK